MPHWPKMKTKTMDVCYSGYLYSKLRTFNFSVYSLKHCVTLHKNSGGAGAKTGSGLEPLSPIASEATELRIL